MFRISHTDPRVLSKYLMVNSRGVSNEITPGDPPPGCHWVGWVGPAIAFIANDAKALAEIATHDRCSWLAVEDATLIADCPEVETSLS